MIQRVLSSLHRPLGVQFVPITVTRRLTMRRSLVLLTLAAPSVAFLNVGPLLSPASSVRQMGLRLRGGSVAMSGVCASCVRALCVSQLRRTSIACLGYAIHRNSSSLHRAFSGQFDQASDMGIGLVRYVCHVRIPDLISRSITILIRHPLRANKRRS